MLIDQKAPAIAALLAEWKDAPRTNESSERFRHRLAKTVLEPMLQPFAGQLILFSYKFLTMEPTGGHSFAHGTEMWSKDVHRLTAGRLASAHPLSIFAAWEQGPLYVTQSPGKKPEAVMGRTGSKNYFAPAQWLWHTQMRYRRGATHPHFIMHKDGPSYESARSDEVTIPAIDISDFGRYLFRLSSRKSDWATNISIIVGTKSVKKWLIEHTSLTAFNRLSRL